MGIKVVIETGNAAFSDDAVGPEIARILRGLADSIANKSREKLSSRFFPLRDANGNKVGEAEFSEIIDDDL
jgi:hypothetical protein